MIVPIAKLLNIPESMLFSNHLLFDADGNYTGFDDKVRCLPRACLPCTRACPVMCLLVHTVWFCPGNRHVTHK